MDDRSSERAGSHPDGLEVGRRSKYHMVGGSSGAGVQIETANAKSTDFMEEDEPRQSLTSNVVSFDGEEPTEEELATLRRVADHLPLSAFIVALVELCERFTYYGVSGPFQNYIQYHPHDTPVRGGIGTTLSSLTASQASRLTARRLGTNGSDRPNQL